MIPAFDALIADICVLIRGGNDEAAVRHRRATEVAVGDITDSQSVRRALAGIVVVFDTAPACRADEAEVGRRFVTEAYFQERVGQDITGASYA